MNKYGRLLVAAAAAVLLVLFSASCPTPQGKETPLSDDASLSTLEIEWVNVKPLEFGFAPGTFSYILDIPNCIHEVSVTPTANYTEATIKVNGSSVTSGQAVVAPCSVGAYPITVEVTAEDGITVASYVVQVARDGPDPANAKLAWLSLSQGSLSPVFHNNTLSYTATVPLAVDQIAVTPFTCDLGATVKVNGGSATHATPFGPVALSPGNNTITVMVTAANLTTTETYTVTVKRASNNANLASLGVWYASSLSPAFDPNTLSYTASFPYSASQTYIDAAVAGIGASLKINGTSYGYGGTCGPIDLNVGANPNIATIVVTAEDGVTTKTYSVSASRTAASSNANLASLGVWYASSLSPAFDPNTLSYTASFPYSASQTYIDAAVAGIGASLKINGTSYGYGGTCGPIDLNVGANPNIATIVVTAEDGVTTKTYSVSASRTAASSNANLASLGVWYASSLSPAFDPNTLSYTASFPYSASQTYIDAAVAGIGASLKINGTSYGYGGTCGPIDLNVGANPNIATIVVTAEDGVTTKTYSVSASRTAASSNANLASLGVWYASSLSPAFDPNTLSYTASFPYSASQTYIDAAVAGIGASLKINGTSYGYGGTCGPIDLNVGTNPNIATIVVTAEDGVTTKTYTVSATRASP